MAAKVSNTIRDALKMNEIPEHLAIDGPKEQTVEGETVRVDGPVVATMSNGHTFLFDEVDLVNSNRA